MSDIAPEGQQPTQTAEHKGVWARIASMFGKRKPAVASSPIAPTAETPMASPITPMTPEPAAPAAPATPLKA